MWEVSWAHPKFGVLLASCSYDRQVLIHREAEGYWSTIYSHRFHDSSGASPGCKRVFSKLSASPDSGCCWCR